MKIEKDNLVIFLALLICVLIVLIGIFNLLELENLVPLIIFLLCIDVLFMALVVLNSLKASKKRSIELDQKILDEKARMISHLMGIRSLSFLTENSKPNKSSEDEFAKLEAKALSILKEI